MTEPKLDKSTLYRQALGDSFDALPSVLRTFHALSCGGKAAGMLRVTRGPGKLRAALSVLMNLPKPGDAVAVTLEVRASAGRETWSRTFDRKRLVTRQWVQNGLLIEAAGPLRFGFVMSCDANGMEFAFARAWLMGMPLPLVVSPRVSATVRGTASGWHVCVRIELPGLGLLTCYEGELTPLC